MNNRLIVKILVLIIILILGIKLLLHYKFYAYITYYNQVLINFIQSSHPYDDIVFIIVQVLQVLAAGILPAEISGFVGGYLYGPIVGTIYSTIGLSIGSWLAFLLSRVYGLPLVRRLVKPSILEKYDHFIDVRGPFVSFFLFLIPGFPKAALCYIIGLSKMNIWTFIAVSTVGRLFGTILLTLTGDSVRTMRIAVLFVIFGLIAIFYLFVYFFRHKLLAMTRQQNNKEL